MAPRIVQHFISGIVKELEQNLLMEEEDDEADLNDISENLVPVDEIQQQLVAQIASLRRQIQEFNTKADLLRTELRKSLADSQQLRNRMQKVMNRVKKKLTEIKKKVNQYYCRLSNIFPFLKCTISSIILVYQL